VDRSAARRSPRFRRILKGRESVWCSADPRTASQGREIQFDLATFGNYSRRFWDSKNSADARKIFAVWAKRAAGARRAGDNPFQASAAFHWDGIGFDEGDVHQGKILESEAAGFGEITRESGTHEAVISRGICWRRRISGAAAARNQREASRSRRRRGQESLKRGEDGPSGRWAGGFWIPTMFSLGRGEERWKASADAGAALNAVENEGIS